MDTQKLREIGATWKRLDDTYDNALIALIDSPEPGLISPEKLEEMKKMQAELFDLEVELYKVLGGE